MDVHDIILKEWRENVAKVIAGKDPLDEPGGLRAYMELFPGEKSYTGGGPGWSATVGDD